MPSKFPCNRHPDGAFYGKKIKRCKPCASMAVTRRIRKVKGILVEEAGGECMKCGYNKSLRALQFHHRDPSTKSFGLSGGSIGIDRQREEAKKCDLLCANCHAEIEEKLQLAKEAAILAIPLSR